jgi:hypothetical protein
LNVRADDQATVVGKLDDPLHGRTIAKGGTSEQCELSLQGWAHAMLAAVMTSSIEQFGALKAQDGALDSVEGRPFLTLVTMESGMQFGLVERDGALCWARAASGVLVFFEPGTERRFLEWFEEDREAFEDAIAEAASTRGFDGRAVADSVPAMALVEGILALRTPLVCRLALRWVLPTELRPLRSAIAGVAADRTLPQDVRDLAERMTVRVHDEG